MLWQQITSASFGRPPVAPQAYLMACGSAQPSCDMSFEMIEEEKR